MSLFAMTLSMMAAATPGAATPDDAGTIRVTPAGSRASAAGPAEYFTGRVRIDAPFQGQAPARIGGATVTFEPGARTAWHTHPLGQLLFVLSGEGWAQTEGGSRQVIRAGDTVWFEPGEKHWHGASATKAMSHVAIAESLDGRSVDWLEHVSEADYLG